MAIRFTKTGGTYNFVESAANSAGVHVFYCIGGASGQNVIATATAPTGGTDVIMTTITTEIGLYNSGTTTTLNSTRKIQYSITDGTNTSVYQGSLNGLVCNKTAKNSTVTCSKTSGTGVFKNGATLTATITILGSVQDTRDRFGPTCYSDSDTTLYTTGNALQRYAITFNANGGDGAPSTQYKINGTNLTLSTTKPTKASTSPTGYTVTFDANGGSCSTSSSIASRTTTYTFSSWNTKSDGSGTTYSSGGSYTANAVATLYARYTSSTATSAISLPTATRDGYDFQGWATSKTATSGTTGNYTPSSSLTLYAIWKAKTYTITLNANGGNIGSSNSTTKTVTYNSTYGTLSTPTKQGYSFNGWFTATTDGTQITSSTTVKILKNTTYYAQWTKNSYTITFNTQGGTMPSGISTTRSQPYADLITNMPQPTKTDYSFKGWCMNFDGSNCVKYGKACKFTTKLNVHFNAYMDNWADYATSNYRIVSCTETGGWNLESNSGKIQFALYSADDNAYKVATANTTWASLSSGWHTFDLIFEGAGTGGKIYLDGNLIITGPTISGKIKYNPTNGIFVGAEAASDEVTPAGNYFKGKIANFIIADNTIRYSANEYNRFRMPAQNVTLHAVWELIEKPGCVVIFTSETGKQSYRPYIFNGTSWEPYNAYYYNNGWQKTNIKATSVDN